MILIFDLDDTLVQTHKKAYEKTLAIAKTFGKVLSFQDFRKAYGKMDFPSCVNFWFDDVDSKEFRSRYNTIRKQYPYEPVGNISGLLQKLAQENEIGILTNSTPEGTDYKLNCLGFPESKRNFFEFIYHKENSVAPKPDPRQIQIINSNGFSLDEMVYIGDNVRDFEFASAGGISFYAVLTGLETKNNFLNVGLDNNKIIDNVHYLIDKI
jgi:phosphoglycolate phosphatase-like HAD superfamily hydrolase